MFSSKWPRNLTFFSLTLKIMKKEQVFIERTELATDTVYQTNGSIEITPCGFARGRQLVHGGTKVSQCGRMTTQDDGTSYFKPYRQNTGTRFTQIYGTAHGSLKSWPESITLNMCFPKKLGKKLILKLFQEEIKEIIEWMNKNPKQIEQ